MSKDTSPEVAHALQEIEEVITRNLNVLVRGLPGVDDAEVMLGDWGIVYSVTDMDDSATGWVDARCALHMPYHHWIGLLKVATAQEELEPDEEDE